VATPFFSGKFSLKAKLSQKENQKYQHYENELIKVKGQTIDKKEINLSLKKSPIIVLNFWASWCNPCLQEFESLNKFIEKYKYKATVVGINADEEEPEKDIDKINKKFNLKFETIVDHGNKISKKFGVETLPYSIIFLNGKVFKVTDKKMDYTDQEFLSKLDDEL
jgi:thiol-disulfide isomerase/thioredoxin